MKKSKLYVSFCVIGKILMCENYFGGVGKIFGVWYQTGLDPYSMYTKMKINGNRIIIH